MPQNLIYPVGSTPAAEHAVKALKLSGFSVLDHPAPEVTHLLLDTPSFQKNGLLRGGNDIADILETLPDSITVIGGNLSHPALAGYKCIDLLHDSEYLAQNAFITAQCALQIAAAQLPSTLSATPSVVIGWGRIGKCLGKILKDLGADPVIAARNASDRAMLHALGYRAIHPSDILRECTNAKLLLNTVPEPVLDLSQGNPLDDCLKIDLASFPGIIGEDVIQALGLPGRYAPETSGKLIAESAMRLISEEVSAW